VSTRRRHVRHEGQGGGGSRENAWHSIKSMIFRDGIRVFSMSSFARTIFSHSPNRLTWESRERHKIIVAKNRRPLGHTMGATPWPPAVQRLGDVFVGSLILVAPLWIGWQLHDGGGGGGELPSWVGDVGPAAHQWWDQWTTMVRGNMHHRIITPPLLLLFPRSFAFNVLAYMQQRRARAAIRAWWCKH
jgi:hypothetical protein